MYAENENGYKKVDKCPYCEGTDIVKRGIRKKKYEEVQRYYCKDCDKSFISIISKHKTYPLRVILESITLYNRLNSREEVAEVVSEKYGMNLSGQTILNWIESYKDYLPFLRMREFIEGKYDKREMIEETKMFHKQIYDFKYHRAKLDCILKDSYTHYQFKPLKDFLELVIAECPHQIFKKDTTRSSEQKDVFNLDGVKIVPKTNTACKIANFVLQAVTNNKLRHEVLQEFMLVNDSVTVATEVPVLLNEDDINHFKFQLGFDVPLEYEEVITGHIDIIQVRNGMIHILDYKPSARKAKPVDQLTIYALALSRLTTIRLYHMKCGWFDKENYYEFFPLHMVYNKKMRGKRK